MVNVYTGNMDSGDMTSPSSNHHMNGMMMQSNIPHGQPLPQYSNEGGHQQLSDGTNMMYKNQLPNYGIGMTLPQGKLLIYRS
jgi:hypothetical protein